MNQPFGSGEQSGVVLDFYEALRVFRAVAERLSFTRAAEALATQKATVSTTVQSLEAALGVRLLERTTRRVTLTPEGAHFLERCQRLLADADDARAMFRKDTEAPRGPIRIDMSAGAAEHVVIPLLPEFTAAHPGVTVQLSSFDGRVDLLREGIDCAIRGGSKDDELVSRDLGRVHFVNCAAPGYLKTFGTPASPGDLGGHRLIEYVTHFARRPAGFEWTEEGKPRAIDVPTSLFVNSTSSYAAACVAGLGLAQIPHPGAWHHLNRGTLVEVLPRHRAEPYELRLVHHQRRFPNRRVMIFMDWLEHAVRRRLNEMLR